jgi:hypothetical protein
MVDRSDDGRWINGSELSIQINQANRNTPHYVAIAWHTVKRINVEKLQRSTDVIRW